MNKSIDILKILMHYFKMVLKTSEVAHKIQEIEKNICSKVI